MLEAQNHQLKRTEANACCPPSGYLFPRHHCSPPVPLLPGIHCSLPLLPSFRSQVRIHAFTRPAALLSVCDTSPPSSYTPPPLTACHLTACQTPKLDKPHYATPKPTLRSRGPRESRQGDTMSTIITTDHTAYNISSRISISTNSFSFSLQPSLKRLYFPQTANTHPTSFSDELSSHAKYMKAISYKPLILLIPKLQAYLLLPPTFPSSQRAASRPANPTPVL